MQRQYVLVQLHDKGKISVPEGSPTHQKAVKQIQGWHVVGEPYTPKNNSGPGGQPQSQKKSPAVAPPATNRPAAERAVGKGQRLTEAIPVPKFDSSEVLEPIRSPKRFENLDDTKSSIPEVNENITATNSDANESPPIIATSKGKPGPKPKIK